jgi:hypothetical protein
MSRGPSLTGSLFRQLTQNAFAEFLRLAEELLVFDELPIQLKGLVGRQPLAQDHVADVNGIRQHGVFRQLFQRGTRIVVIHKHQFVIEEFGNFEIWKTSLEGESSLVTLQPSSNPKLQNCQITISHHFCPPQVVQVNDAAQSHIPVDHDQGCDLLLFHDSQPSDGELSRSDGFWVPGHAVGGGQV